jgi:hypothetical protein
LPPFIPPVLAWPAGRQFRRAATDRIGDLLREARVAERPAAIGRRPQRRNEFVAEPAAEQRTIRLSPRLATALRRSLRRR